MVNQALSASGLWDIWKIGYEMAALALARTNCTAYARAAWTYVDSGIGLVKIPTGVQEQP